MSDFFTKTLSIWSLFLLGIGPLLFAQTGDVRGFVYDEATGEPVIFSNVFLAETTYGSATDVNGFYSINKIKVGDYVLTATTIGYDTTRIDITIREGEIITQKIFLNENDVLLQAVEIEGQKEAARKEVGISSVKITPKQIKKIPAIGGEPDLAQYLQILPGVVFTGDQGGQLYIRGGSLIQTRVLLDGVRVYNPFHSIGLFSVFETDIIKNVEVHTGGFDAEYGGAISAIIDIKTRDGNKKKLSGKIAANTFLAKALLEGPVVKLKDDGSGFSASYILSSKFSYLDRSSKVFYNYINEEQATSTSDEILPYTFTDLYGKFSLTADNGSKLGFSAHRYTDDADFLDTSLFNWDDFGMGMNFVLIPGQSKTLMDGYIAYSKYSIALREADSKPRNSSIGGFNFGVNFSYFLPFGLVKYGVEVAGFDTEFNFYNPLGIKIEEVQHTTELATFLKFRGNFGKLVIEPSVRFNVYASLSTASIEPRLGVKYNVSDRFRLKFAGGLYSQNFVSTKSDRDVVNLFTGFLSAPEVTLKRLNGETAASNLQKSVHGIGGFEFDITKRWNLNVEGYYKGFPQLININRNKLFPPDPNYVLEEGDAYGLDFLIKYDYKNWFIWAVYSLAYVNREDATQVYPPHFDRRHNVNFLASYAFGKDLSWELSARWNLGSGFPFTKTQGFYEQLDFSNGIDGDILEQNGLLGVIFDEQLNGGRLPTYHRFDIALKKNIEFSNDMKLEASASLTNIYNRDNIFYFDRIRYTRINQLPILPSMGVSLSF